MTITLKDIFFDLKEEDIKELENYDSSLQKAIDSNKDGEVVLNLGENHAALLMTKMLERTTNSLTMVVGAFDGNVSNKVNYSIAFEQCLKRNVDTKILFINEPNRESKAIQLLKKYKGQGNKIETKQANEDTKMRLKNAFNNDGTLVHFSVFDDSMYRVETVPSKYTAYGSFKDTVYCKKLLGIFNSLFDNATEFSA